MSVVRKDSRRLGVGWRLVEAVEKDFVRRGIKRVALSIKAYREKCAKSFTSRLVTSETGGDL